jgi:hypothetical protein
MTTTGYGDAFPQTALGKLLGCLTMLSGLVVLALPITVISENFAHAYQSQEKKQQKQREAEMQVGCPSNNQYCALACYPSDTHTHTYTHRHTHTHTCVHQNRGKPVSLIGFGCCIFV